MSDLGQDMLLKYEALAYAGGSLVHRALQDMLLQFCRQQHEMGKALTDPMFMYSGGRATRAAIVSRDAEIDSLRKQLEDARRTIKEMSTHPPLEEKS